MTDARWLEVHDDIDSAVRHFRNAVAIETQGLSAADDLPAYIGRMAFLQAMQAGYTSLEGALERILEILGEEKPASVHDYHAQLVRRVGRPIEDDRPAILEGALLAAVDEARRFRHVARKSYDDFDVSKAASAIRAAKTIAAGLAGAIEVFRGRIESGDTRP